MDPARGRELLRAAQELFVELGYEQLSMDAVAARVGASKATLYRRWPSKPELVVAAVEAFAWDEPMPNLGGLRQDLIAMAQVWFDPDQQRDRLFVRLLTALPEDDRLYEIYRSRIAMPRAKVFQAIIDRAVERGEILDPTAAQRVGGILPALAFQRLVVQRTPVDKAFIEHVLDDIVLPLLVAPHHGTSSQR